jgi:S-formylglutathione hydrolase FrmB
MILRGNFSSAALCMSTNIQVLIPDKADSPYRVVYLLHGLHGDQGTWLDNTMLPCYAKKYNAAFVMPEAGRSFYLNQKYGRKYYDFVSGELPAVCRKVFNISAKREETAAMGCSMGGYGALKLAFSCPDQFGFCGAISPACLSFKPILDGLRSDPEPYLKTGMEAEEVLKDFRALYGDGLEYRADYDISHL